MDCVTPDDEATAPANETIGNYRVVQQLGAGSMGLVYLAEHPIMGRRVAIKLLHPVLSADPDVVTRFFNEARAINMSAHENIVEILDFGQTDGGQPYFIMELLEGEPLSEHIARGPMDPGQVALIADQMCRALGAAHAKGIVHRDLKPQNVQLVTKADGSLQAKILDFGVAKILASAEGMLSAKTRTGLLMGTPLYMSPEQCRGSGPIDCRSDVYALGVMLFEMLAGRPPFVAEGLGELFALHMFQPAPALAELALGVPPHVATAVMKALAKVPDDRFQSMEELRAALTSPADLEPPAPRPLEPDVRAAPRRPGWKAPALIAALAAAAVVAYAARPASRRQVARRSPALLAQPAPRTATLRFESDPPGADVVDDQGKDLGRTPLEVALPRGKTAKDYVLRLADHRQISLAVVPDADRTLHVLLDPLMTASTSGGATKRPIRHRAKKSGLSLDDEDLATPSF
ncbi:MAG TPA: serine/threonine-protein kinase [Polyangia bacterium]|nr:serine/threonine-protein kinase [Polyangia bacterium]